MNINRAPSTRHFGPIGWVLVALVLGACAPVSDSVAVQPTVSVTQVSPATAPELVATQAATTVAPPSPGPQPVATSRGPDLEASEPGTVSLASGSLQLVEFFRFT